MRWLRLISAMLIVSIPAINGETSIGGPFRFGGERLLNAFGVAYTQALR